MKTYNTYQEAKIANPECEIANFINDKGMQCYMNDCHFLGCFVPVIKDSSKRCGYAYSDEKMNGSPNITDGFWKVCNPSDYCMTVEEFLKTGYEFEIGDLVFNKAFDKVDEIDCETDVDDYNMLDENDKNRYILRAAALEKPKRTKFEFAKVNQNYDGGAFWECAKDYSEGVTFTSMSSAEQLVINDIDDLLDRYKCNNLYRRIETEIEWWEDAASFASSCDGVNHVTGNSNGISIQGEMTRDQWCDFARILLEQEGE